MASFAEQILMVLNPNALIGEENGRVCFIEDVTDLQGREYRMEIQSTPDGQHALGWCRFNPHGPTPNAGVPFVQGHCRDDGFLCLAPNQHGDKVETSPYDAAWCVRRARYWAIAFSVLKETGEFPQPDEE